MNSAINPIGWREYASAPQANPATLDALRELAVSLLSDNMARASGMVGLRPYHQPKPMAGTAVTVAGIGLTEAEAIQLINTITDELEGHHHDHTR